MASIWSRVRAAKAKEEKSLGSAARHGSYMVSPGQPVWTRRAYDKLAEEGYIRNVVAHRAIAMVAGACASVPVCVKARGDERLLSEHPALALLAQPNPMQDQASLIEQIILHRMISGNAYMLATGADVPLELHSMRPDRVQVLAPERGASIPSGYRLAHAQGHTDYGVDALSGHSRVLHWKHFHPLDDWYGLSDMDAAAYSIDQHNAAGQWNQSMLQHGARPSGALVVKSEDGNAMRLGEEQYQRLKNQMDEQFSGAGNAGRPLLLEGGLDWKEMSLSPKDMDFIEAKHSSARDIALAFGVPPQLLGIPGDNTYSNLHEARLALWEQTIIPTLEHLLRAVGQWLLPYWGDKGLMLVPHLDEVSALSPRRNARWERINNATFLSDDEKKQLLGL